MRYVDIESDTGWWAVYDPDTDNVYVVFNSDYYECISWAYRNIYDWDVLQRVQIKAATAEVLRKAVNNKHYDYT